MKFLKNQKSNGLLPKTWNWWITIANTDADSTLLCNFQKSFNVNIRHSISTVIFPLEKGWPCKLAGHRNSPMTSRFIGRSRHPSPPPISAYFLSLFFVFTRWIHVARKQSDSRSWSRRRATKHGIWLILIKRGTIEEPGRSFGFIVRYQLVVTYEIERVVELFSRS